MPYLPDNRLFSRRPQRIHIDAPTIHLTCGSHLLRWILAALVLAGGMAYLGRMIYLLDRENAQGDLGKVETVVDELQLKIAQLEKERDALSQSVATLERAAQVDKEAQRHVQEELMALQEERQQLQEEVAVLKRVAGKTKGTAKSGNKPKGGKSSKKKSKSSNKNSGTKKLKMDLPADVKKGKF